jgi:hypothetical protein
VKASAAAWSKNALALSFDWNFQTDAAPFAQHVDGRRAADRRIRNRFEQL